MADKSYDLIVIGSGPGGYVAAIRASQLGMKVAVVEKAELGGICLNWGCIPTKALLKSAQVYDYIKHAKDYGIDIKDHSVDFPTMVKRSRNTAAKMSKGIQFLFRKNKIDTLVGHGKVISKGSVEVSGEDKKSEIYKAKHIILATGGRSRELPSLPIDNEKIVGYRKAMVMEKQPKRMVVVGSGAIGMEFAYFYHTIGTEVTVVEFMPRILPVEDEEVSKQLEKIYKKSGIKIMTSSEVTSVDTKGKGCKVKVKTQKGEESIDCDVVLSAVGIATNLENLGIEQAGIKLNDKKNQVQVDEYYRTNVDGIYAIGDIVKGPALAHVASAEGIICVEKIAGMDVEPLDYNNLPGCTYCWPEVASVGYTEQGARDAGYDIRVGKFPFSASGKASAAGANEGFVKLIFDKKYGEWLGAHMLGANVTEMIAEVVAARKLETTGHEIIKSVHPHPTMSEAVMEAAAAAYDEVIHL
ncbi:dihydrolipoamide dehydrogenase [Catalinimonas alkaloidigena]|uniref:dihydrolipoyl dehydrogenase n=1 Tax=Catalinimonas alkaloidigena TaxID=1075417 RepID=UPI0024072B3A|nr:dihydrolipoyl dehydrogenase [Catalinimonas alkaloidigena]MDF9800244.1 dihydrolipoamide dehydrogenase [Catalinimonas alkaloidigena]